MIDVSLKNLVWICLYCFRKTRHPKAVEKCFEIMSLLALQ